MKEVILMKKVLFMTNYPSPYRVHFFNELGKMCDLTVLFEETPEEQTHRDKDWFCTDYTNFKAVFLKQHKLKPHKVFCPEVTKYIKKGYDHIIIGVYSTFTAMYAIMYMRLHKIKYMISTDGGMAKNGKGFFEKLKKFLIGGACGYFSPSKVADKYLNYYGAKKNNIYRYPFTSLYRKDILDNPLNQDEKTALKKKLDIKENKMILSIGQFIHRKGFDILIKSSKDINDDIGIYILGGEPTKQYLDLCKKYNVEDKIHFVGFKTGEDLANYYKASDLFVLPTREDVWGLVINEAMAYGLPVVTTDKCVAGLELVNSKNGKIIPVNNVKALSLEINKILSLDDDSIRKLQEVSLKRIKKYTFENMAKVHMDILKD